MLARAPLPSADEASPTLSDAIPMAAPHAGDEPYTGTGEVTGEWELQLQADSDSDSDSTCSRRRHLSLRAGNS